MFSDPFSNLMLVLLLFFCGLLVMFIFMMRSLENNWRNQEEARLQMSLSLSDLENKLDALLRLAGANPANTPQDEGFELRSFAAGREAATSAEEELDEPIYEQACAPAWAAAQEYDAAGNEAPASNKTAAGNEAPASNKAAAGNEAPASNKAAAFNEAPEVAYETIEVISAPVKTKNAAACRNL